jgi:ATP-dependent protease ClpP protease subunit
MKPWFRFENVAAGETTADIHIIDFIGGWAQDAMNRAWGEDLGVTARAFVEQLNALKASGVKNARVYINSPGGDVQGGVNIANALRQWASEGRTVETYVTGIAASIASVIAMAGSKVHIADNALFMVHNPMSIIVGNAGEMRQMADVLDTVRTQIVATYKWHSNLSDEELIALIDGTDGQGTWMDADQAIANGFATDKIDGLKAAASITPAAVAKLAIPDHFKARVDALLEKPAQRPAPAVAADVLRVCREAHCLELAEALLAEGAPLADVQSRVSAERARKDQATARSNEITAACAIAKLPQLAAGYIAGGLAVADVQTHLTTIKALIDNKTEIDGGINPDHGAADIAAGWKRAFGKR